jgi:hypothetical protein
VAKEGSGRLLYKKDAVLKRTSGGLLNSYSAHTEAGGRGVLVLGLFVMLLPRIILTPFIKYLKSNWG